MSSTSGEVFSAVMAHSRIARPRAWMPADGWSTMVGGRRPLDGDCQAQADA
ncbi:hypothetical protein M768_16400 [Cellulosimicrobium cellulans F16]|uniref:Uncharacterized protein n=1 Tax=Cellulosimicrobium cellulans F16 TaxID=1350482 RepID=A0A0M0F3U0_CELCE|nr:hypothetical protein M768_16400 [Cellulosimicrobium cellulans F16]